MINSILANLAASRKLLGAATGSKQTITVAQAFKLFKEEADRIWGKDEMSRVTFKLDPNPPANKQAMATLSWRGKRREGTYPRDKTFILSINPNTLSYPLKAIRSILIHEAVHIAYPRHTKAFYAKNKREGGSESEHSALGGEKKFFVQLKVGHRFKDVHEAKSEDEAMKWAKEEMKTNPEGRYRLNIVR